MTSRKKSPKDNIALGFYNHHFAGVRRSAKEENLDLSLKLSRIIRRESLMFFLDKSTRITTLPDTSKMKQRDRELCLKEWYRPYYY